MEKNVGVPPSGGNSGAHKEAARPVPQGAATPCNGKSGAGSAASLSGVTAIPTTTRSCHSVDNQTAQGDATGGFLMLRIQQ